MPTNDDFSWLPSTATWFELKDLFNKRYGHVPQDLELDGFLLSLGVNGVVTVTGDKRYRESITISKAKKKPELSRKASTVTYHAEPLPPTPERLERRIEQLERQVQTLLANLNV